MSAVPLLDVGSWFAEAIGGSMALAIPVALVAGLVSFFSPCVVPLLPGYLSYATGLGVAEVTGADGVRQRGRILLGTSLFVLGFGVVFVSTGAIVGGLGSLLLTWRRELSIVGGLVAIVLGLIFAGVIPLGQRTLRVSRAPAVGLAAAPLLGVVFGIGWTPCIGPTLAAVLTLALNEATASRGAFLAAFYALGLGVPFLVAGLAFDKMAGTASWVGRHHVALQRLGGGLLALVGVLLVTGLWDRLMAVMRQWVSAFGLVV